MSKKEIELLNINCRGNIIQIDKNIWQLSEHLKTVVEIGGDKYFINCHIDLFHELLDLLPDGKTDNEKILTLSDFFGFDISRKKEEKIEKKTEVIKMGYEIKCGIIEFFEKLDLLVSKGYDINHLCCDNESEFYRFISYFGNFQSKSDFYNKGLKRLINEYTGNKHKKIDGTYIYIDDLLNEFLKNM
jgi:hypothetical protein